MSGIMPIPFSAICKYAEVYELHGEDFEDLRHFIRVLDNTLLQHHEQSSSKPKHSKNQISF